MQESYSDLEYAAKKKLTRRDRFLAGISSDTPEIFKQYVPGFHQTFLGVYGTEKTTQDIAPGRRSAEDKRLLARLGLFGPPEILFFDQAG